MKNISIFLQIILAFLLPIKEMILIVGLMIIFDTITGLYKSRKLKIPITSNKLSALISKLFLYEMCLITSFIVDKYVVGEFISIFSTIPFFLTKIVCLFMVGVEVTSIAENYKAVSGVSVWDKFKQMTRRIKDAKQEIEDIKN
jgi:hypothetical protein